MIASSDEHHRHEDLRLVDKTFRELTVDELYEFLRLRCDVFVVEQECAYHELDGRDREPETRHVWFELAAAPNVVAIVAYLRVLYDASTMRIGRVVTDPHWRAQGLAGELLAAVINETNHEVVLDAQSRLAAFYTGFGFAVDGDEFIEDGIAHVPMRRPRSLKA